MRHGPQEAHRRDRPPHLDHDARHGRVGQRLCGDEPCPAVLRRGPRIDPQKLETGSRELESRATALYSEARQPGQWQAAFTSDQINGWLALQLAEVYADALPDEISEPRVAIEDDHLTVGFRPARRRRHGRVGRREGDAHGRRRRGDSIALRAGGPTLPLPVMQSGGRRVRGMSETVAAGPLEPSRRPARGDCRAWTTTKVEEAHVVLDAVEFVMERFILQAIRSPPSASRGSSP